MNCIVYNNKCIIDVRVSIITDQVTDNIHSTVQMPVTRYTSVMHTRRMIVMPDWNYDSSKCLMC